MTNGDNGRREITERSIPMAREAEMSVVGSMFIAPTVSDEVTMIVRPDDFFFDDTRILFERISELYNRSSGIDSQLLAADLTSEGLMDRIGGVGNLYKIVNAVPHASHATHYAHAVREASRRRAIIHAATEMLTAGYNDQLSSDEAVDYAETVLYGVTDNESARETQPTSLADMLAEAIEQIDARRDGRATQGLSTGLGSLNEALGGLRAQELIILGGRPAHGKSALGAQMALAAAESARILMFSLEMGQQEITERMISSTAGVDLTRIRDGTMTDEERRRVTAGAAELATRQFWVDDAASRSVSEIAAIARRHSRRPGLDLVVVDYLQLIQPDSERKSREQQVAYCSRRLKLLARELDIPVLCLAQVNRGPSESTRAPRLSDLRESGSIEQDADVVLFVHRPAEYNPALRPANGSEPEVAQVLISKQRNGPTGIIEMHWRRRTARFEDMPSNDPVSYQQSFGEPYAEAETQTTSRQRERDRQQRTLLPPRDEDPDPADPRHP